MSQEATAPVKPVASKGPPHMPGPPPARYRVYFGVREMPGVVVPGFDIPAEEAEKTIETLIGLVSIVPQKLRPKNQDLSNSRTFPFTASVMKFSAPGSPESGFKIIPDPEIPYKDTTAMGAYTREELELARAELKYQMRTRLNRLKQIDSDLAQLPSSDLPAPLEKREEPVPTGGVPSSASLSP